MNSIAFYLNVKYSRHKLTNLCILIYVGIFRHQKNRLRKARIGHQDKKKYAYLGTYGKLTFKIIKKIEINLF